MIDKFETVVYMLAFVVPGFLCSTVIGLFIPRRSEDAKLAVIRWFALTFACFAVFTLLNLIPWWKLVDSGMFTNLGLALYFVVAPITAGLILGVAGQRDWMGRVLGRLGFNTIHAIPTSWDYVFGSAEPS